MIQLALYKGPPASDIWHMLGHLGIRLWTWSRWSHAELVINGTCYSSSSRDGGVRGKVIDLSSGRWDVIEIPMSPEDISQAWHWFERHAGAKYDWLGIARFVAPFFGHDRKRFVCFESIGSALGMAGAQKLTANDLYEWVIDRRSELAAACC